MMTDILVNYANRLVSTKNSKQLVFRCSIYYNFDKHWTLNFGENVWTCQFPRLFRNNKGAIYCNFVPRFYIHNTKLKLATIYNRILLTRPMRKKLWSQLKKSWIVPSGWLMPNIIREEYEALWPSTDWCSMFNSLGKKIIILIFGCIICLNVVWNLWVRKFSRLKYHDVNIMPMKFQVVDVSEPTPLTLGLF